jgi:hypothetical protein
MPCTAGGGFAKEGSERGMHHSRVASRGARCLVKIKDRISNPVKHGEPRNLARSFHRICRQSQTRRQALTQVETSLLRIQENDDSQALEPGYLGDDGSRCRQLLPSGSRLVEQITTFLSGSSDRDRTCDLGLMSPTL